MSLNTYQARRKVFIGGIVIGLIIGGFLGFIIEANLIANAL